jgi:hypothetical protein
MVKNGGRVLTSVKKNTQSYRRTGFLEALAALQRTTPPFVCLACLTPSILRDHHTHAKARNESDAKAKKEQKRLIHVLPLERPQESATSLRGIPRAASASRKPASIVREFSKRIELLKNQQIRGAITA